MTWTERQREATIPRSAAHRVRMVGSFEELIAARFAGDVNALCWPRQLPGNYQEIIDRLAADDGLTTIDDDLDALALSAAGCVARDVIRADLALLRAHDLAPTLDCIVGYPRDPAAGVIATDVYSFHADRAPIEADTWLCTYVGQSSEGLANECAIRRVDQPDIRAQLLKASGLPDGEAFAAYLAEHSYDLHYAALAGAEPYTFGVGNLWRIAIAHPESPVAPCIHRAPSTRPGDPSRLLLIS